MAGAEVVERDPYAGCCDVVEHRDRAGYVGEARRFGDLENQGFGAEAQSRERVAHDLGKAMIGELTWCNVDRHRQLVADCVAQVAEIPQRPS